MVLASDKAHSQNIRFIRGINFSVFFSKNRKESFLRWLGAAFPAPLCVPLVCPASGRCPRHLSAIAWGKWMPHHTPGTGAGRRLRRKRNFRRRAGTDPDRAQALCGKRTGQIRTVSGSGKEAAGIPLLTAPSQGYFRMRGVFRSGSIRQDKPGEHSMKTWLITGCSSGLGKGLAEAVLEHGDEAVVTSRRPETLRILQTAIPGPLCPCLSMSAMTRRRTPP